MKQLHENIYTSGQLLSEDFATLAEAGIKTIINNRPDDEETGQLNHQQAQDLATENGLSYHYLPMANGQPLPPTLVADFKSILDASDEPVLAHCRSGMRSSFLWAMGQIGAGKITVEQAVTAAQNAGIPLQNTIQVLESVVPNDAK